MAVTDRVFIYITCTCADPFLFPRKFYNTADTDELTSFLSQLIALRNSLQFTSASSLAPTLLLHKKRIIVAPQLITRLLIEALRLPVLLIDEQADRPRAAQQRPPEL